MGNEGMDWFLLGFLFYPSVLIHEFGHVAACRKYGIEHGSVGIGIYIIFPVAYADISNIWRASTMQRVKANLGGIFMELVYASLLGIIYLFDSSKTAFLVVSMSISVKVLFELNPFVRHDGYWVLSDLTKTPNLLYKGNSAFKKLISKLFGRTTPRLSKAEIYLSLYSLINWMVLLFFMSYSIVVYQSELIYFPAQLAQLFQSIVSGQFSTDRLKEEWVMVFIFYFIVAQYAYQLIRKIHKKIAFTKLKRVV